ncbi:MAG: NADH-quinone oxidoreductase subunit J [Sulfurimonas sp.]|uniref:NADH-quinone oxidoreductase subunit J n=1 Tax=Sulfurimonas sp. TaxID=2022749 RepID=UPI00260BCB64|nr:NADH-quinone oxidoreductase subunit J [Sulfurimonas sp.]MDD5372463.1 NADH-quinone oxidoreductase subunit J [Sulfurimonas sp.]
MFEAVAFYLFAFLTITMFYIAVTTSQALYALSSLAAGMIFISAFFFILGADFLGAVQIVVYSGAVMALYAFGMMFFDTTRDVKEKQGNKAIILGLSILSAILLIVIVSAPIVGSNIEALYPVGSAGNVQEVGKVLFTKYLVPFEVAAVMLLVAMVAGIVLAGKKMDLSLTLMTEAEILMMKEEDKNKKALS